MPDVVTVLLAGVGGLLLSVPMFGGLWWTLRKLPEARHPALFAVASFVSRLAVTIGGVYVITAGDWRRAVAALVGLVAGRILLVRVLGRASNHLDPRGV